MENTATVIAQCKENIQPLRHGRNVSQLGTALRAQEDAEAQQLLQQEKQMYEETIKNYVGDDPLENWFEYISWVEQSFPKSGHESPLAKLLQQCLTNFEKETKYHQDRRFVRLWINYVSMQKNPAELYQLLYNSGIGTMVADLYCAWAFELEQIEDFKRADEVYMIGLNCRAEPREELDSAHKNFQLAVARKMLGRNDERNEVSVAEQRQAFSSLKAIRAGKRVGSIRTGHRVRDYMPGSVPQQINPAQAQRPNAGIQVYQDDAPGDLKGTSILDHVPIEDTVHKENTIKAGPWNNHAKKHPLMTSAVRPAFKVHEDTDVIDMDKLRLFPNHVSFFDDSKYYDQYLQVPVFVPDVPNPNITSKPHYPKDLVYANNMDLSMEQIRAQRYLFKLNSSISTSSQDNSMKQYSMEHQEMEKQRMELVQREQQKESELKRQRLMEQQKEVELERQRQLEQQQREAELERQRLLEQQQREAELARQRLLEQQQREAELERQRQIEQQLERQREMEREQELERQRLQNQSMHTSGYLNHQHSSSATDEQQLLSQSMTVNTKEALSAVQDLWQSPSSRLMPSPVIQRMPSETRKISFDIHMDSSMTQNVMVNSKLHHQQSQQQNYSGAVQPYNDQENNHHYHSSYSNSQQQNSFGNHQVSQNSFHYPIQPHHEQQMQPQHQHHMQSMMHQAQPLHQIIHHQQPPHTMHHHQSPQQPQYPHHYTQPVQHIPPPHIQQHMNTSQGIPTSQHMNTSAHMNTSHHMNTSQQINTSTHMNTSHHMNTSQHSNVSQHINNSQHMNTSQNMSHHSHHMSHQHVQSLMQTSQIHQQPQPQPQPQHHMYNHAPPNSMGYSQPYASPIQHAHPSIEQQPRPIHYSGYAEQQLHDPKASPYRMPSELPHIKSPGINYQDLGNVGNNENKENNQSLTEDSVIKQPQPPDDNRYFIDESLGISPLPGVNETCYTETFNRPLIASTPMTHNFKAYKQQNKHQQQIQHQYQNQPVAPPPQPQPPTTQAMPPPPAELGEKLSVIMESTGEYVSSSSASSGATRIGITITREELPTIKEQSTIDDTSNYMNAYDQQRNNYEQKMRAQIQAVHAQSPRTVQRGVDQITSDIQTNCDLRKSMNFKGGAAQADSTTHDEDDIEAKPDSSMDYEYHQNYEPMEQEAKVEEPEKEEPPFELPEGDINPFDKSLINGLLRMTKFPQDQHRDGYVKLTTNLIKFVPSSTINLGNDMYDLDKCLGKGTYGTVFKGTDLQSRKVVALKTQKPAWVWEYYIAREIKNRLKNPHMLRGFMDVQTVYIAENGSVLVTEFSKYGTLLAVTNKIKISTGKPLSEPLAIFFTIEMIQIVEYLHKCQIIHADIKPDNFLLMHMPSEDVRPTIQLIDYGCSIDMSLFPEGTKFTQIIKTEDFTCIEMQTGKPWTYQTDLYCLAASSHCLLFGNYMRVSMNGKKWYINSKLPRYAKKAVWEQYFTELLNIESCEKLPDLTKLRNMLEEALAQMPELQSKYRQFSNVLNHR